MQAVVMTAAGGVEVLDFRDHNEPEIKSANEVKIKLHAAGVNPVDTKIRAAGLFSAGPLPAILGCDGAGEIIEIGEQVENFIVGDKVWFCHGGLGDEPGNYAEYTVINERWLSKMPQSFTFIEAAAAPLVLITAWGALYDRGGLQAGQTVLIHAGAGGVGHVAIQLAKLKGARVITTVGSEANAEFVCTLGADEVIHYQQQDVVQQVLQLTQNKGAELVLDTVGEQVFNSSIEATAHFGRIVSLLNPGNFNLVEARMRNLLIGFELMLTPMLRGIDEERDKHIRLLQQCADLVDQQLLKICVSETFKLTEVSKAHLVQEERHVRGKNVIVINGE